MIRLRAAIFRGLAHPWLGPAVVLVLALLLALILLHVSIDHAVEASSLMCVAIVSVLVAVVPSLRAVSRTRPAPADGQRAPPSRPTASGAARPAGDPLSSPLRL